MSVEDVAATARFFSSMSVDSRDHSHQAIAFDGSENDLSEKRKRDEDIEMISVIDDSETSDDSETALVPRRKLSKRNRRRELEMEAPTLPVQPLVVRVVKKSRTHVNHSYNDYSIVPPTIDYQGEPTVINAMSFPQKLHHILAQEQYHQWIRWSPHGRAFRIHVSLWFERYILPNYFPCDRYSSFVTKLNNYGFKLISQGKDRNSYYHELFLQGLPHLVQYMPPPKDARRLHPDPKNEPDFYQGVTAVARSDDGPREPVPEAPEEQKEGGGASPFAVSPFSVLPNKSVRTPRTA